MNVAGALALCGHSWGLVPVAAAADLEVGAGRAYVDLQAAIDEAAAGDRIVLYPGLYPPVVVPAYADVEIQSVNLHAATIEAGNSDVALSVDGDLTLRGVVVDAMGGARGVWVEGTLVAEDVVIRGGRSELGGCAVARGQRFVLRRSALTDCEAEGGGGLFAEGGNAVLEAVTLTQSRATQGIGGGVLVQYADLTVVGGSFDGNSADDGYANVYDAGYGGAIAGTAADITVTGAHFTGNAGTSVSSDGGYGGAIHGWQCTMSVASSVFEDNAAGSRGSAVSAWASTLEVDGSWFASNVISVPGDTPYGGTVFCDGDAACDVDRAWFVDNVASDGGGICAVGEATVTTSMFCANTATSDGGGIDVGNHVFGYDTHETRIDGNLFVANHAENDGGGVVLGAPASLANNTFVGNSAGLGGAIGTLVADYATGAVALVDNLVAYNDGGVAGVFLQGPSAARYELWWGNTPIDATTPAPDTAVLADPELAWGGDCDPAALAPSAGSPAVDAGDPQIADADGSRADIGAFGGPSGDLEAFLDEDGDGWAAMVDCDDADSSVNLGVPEVCNGVDDDCDGLVDAEDDAIDADWLHPDPDGDGAGTAAGSEWACPGDGWAPVLEEPLPTTTVDPPPTTPPVGTAGVDADDDGAVDAGDPSPGDAGGVSGIAPTPTYGCGCTSGSPGRLPAVMLGLLFAARRGRGRAPGAPLRSPARPGPRRARRRGWGSG